jgi:hypothetical protein
VRLVSIGALVVLAVGFGGCGPGVAVQDDETLRTRSPTPILIADESW